MSVLLSRVLIFRTLPHKILKIYFSRSIFNRRSTNISFKEKINKNLKFRKVHLIAAFFFSLIFSAAFIGFVGALIEFLTQGKWSQVLSATLGYSLFSIFYTPLLAPPYLLLMTVLILLKILNRYTLAFTGCIFGLAFWLTLHLTENWLPFSEYGYALYSLAGALGGWITYKVLDRNSLENEQKIEDDEFPRKS